MSPTGSYMPPTDQPLAMRLVSLFRQISAVLERFRPDEAAVEETFVNRNPASTLKLGVARGVVLLAPAERGLPVAEYSANLIKKSVVGAGHADKAQVQMMVRRILPGCAIAEPDAADALAVAICHAHLADDAAPDWSACPAHDRQAQPASSTRSEPDAVVIDVGGVGYLVFCSTAHARPAAAARRRRPGC